MIVSFLLRRSVSTIYAAALPCAAALLLAASPVSAHPQACTTTITGKVYSPLGPTAGDPIPNILVFAYPTQIPAFNLNSGPGGCSTQANLVPQTGILGAGTTDASGNFIFSGNAIPANVNIVIQAGKWRRQYTNTAITPCTTNTLQPLTMPSSQGPLNDLPHIAVVTGSVDGVECILNQIGISPSEVTTPGGTGSINLYKGDYSGGQVNPDTTTVNLTPAESTLVSNLNTMNTYDVIMFGCQGSSAQTDNTVANQANILSYTSNGGRVFTTHFEYIWLVDSFPTVATFGNFTTPNPQTQIATIDQTYPEGAILANWIQNVGASYNNTLGQIQLNNTDVNTSVVHNPPSQSWVNLNSATYNKASMQFTFDTPLGQTGVPSVAATYTNVTSTFHPGDANDTIQINVTNSSSTATLPGLTLTVSLPAGLTLNSLADSSTTGGWICANLTCTLSSTLAPSASDSVTLKFSIAANITPGLTSITSALSGGGLSGTGQCGRVLYNDYHVESQSLTKSQTYLYPSQCSTGTLTAQEKFLEFSLYNLSNFVAPVATDVIDIVATPTLAWAMPSPIYYGTPLGPNQLDATSSAPGTFAYTPPAGTILPVGTDTLNAVFTPSDPTLYTSGNISTTINVLQDTTTITLTSSLNPSVLGQSVTFTATVTGNAAAPTGSVTFNIAGQIVTATLTPSTGDSSVATYTTSTLPFGSDTITAVYGATTDFGASSTATLTQVVQGTSTTVITGLVSPIDYGQIIGDTAFIQVNGSSTGGTITVYIDGVNVCVLQVVPGMTFNCPANTGAGYNVGTHSIYAVFSGDPNYQGSTSPTYTVQIVPDPTTTTLTSSLNPSYVGNSVTFTATVAAPYAAPVGTVTFYDGSTQLAPVTVTGTTGLQNVATYSTTGLAIGTHNITATYTPSIVAATGTANFLGSSTANALAQVVLPPLPLNGQPGYILTITPTTLNAPVGAGTAISINVDEVNGYSMPVTLSCTGLPIETTCGFTQATVPAGGGTVTLYLTPAAPHACGSSTPYFIAGFGAKGYAWLGVMGALLLCFFGLRRRRILRGVTLVLAFCVLPVLNGCGTGCTDYGLKPGTYSFTVVATPASGPATGITGTQSQTIVFNATL